MAVKLCSVESCGRPSNARGLCKQHYGRWKSGNGIRPEVPIRPKVHRYLGAKCSVNDCSRVARCNHMCSLHDQRVRAKGDVGSSRPHFIRTGSHDTADGYVVTYAPGHPNSFGSKGRILEHRLVMAVSLGRALLEHETVHHKNGVRNDNHIENLELWSTRHAAGSRVEDLLAYAQWIVKTYGGDA